MPDFEIFWGEWGHIELKHELDRSSGTFFLSGGSLRPVVSSLCLAFIHGCLFRQLFVFILIN